MDQGVTFKMFKFSGTCFMGISELASCLGS